MSQLSGHLERMRWGSWIVFICQPLADLLAFSNLLRAAKQQNIVIALKKGQMPFNGF